jgi:hypothetical protein
VADAWLTRGWQVGEDSVGADGKKVKAALRVLRAVASVDDAVQKMLKAVLSADGAVDCLPKEKLAELKKRSLAAPTAIKSVRIGKGDMFASWGQKVALPAMPLPSLNSPAMPLATPRRSQRHAARVTPLAAHRSAFPPPFPSPPRPPGPVRVHGERARGCIRVGVL